MGVGSGKRVGLCLERGPEMLAGLLGVLKAGGAYVPLDPAFPADRLALMIDDSEMSVLVTQASLTEALPGHAARSLRVDAQASEIAAQDGGKLAPDAAAARPDDVAYVIYTSGSTGKPKGVQVPHRAVVNFLCSMRAAPGLTQDDVLVAVTTLSFDIAVLELLLPLSVGARIVLASRETASDGAALAMLLDHSGATAMQATPSTWRMLLQAGWAGGPGFKAICGGEALAADLAQPLVECTGSLWNMYGPTETTVWSTLERLTNPVGAVSIGRPIANTQVYVLDSRMQLLPIGVPGELHIGGDGVTLGYLNRPELTAERFPADPFRPGARLYKTGDLARFKPDGRLEYLGRNDNQVKVRGFRIELGEIEAVLSKQPGVAQAVVAARELRPGDVRLVGYLIAADRTVPDDRELRERLRGWLPEYMVPQHFVTLERYPLTPNGKIDRKALPTPELTLGATSREFVEPRNESERLVADLWQQALGVARLSASDNFFHLGGHSLLASQVLSRLRRDHGVSLPFRKLFEAPTVEAFAALVAAVGRSTSSHAPRIARRSERSRAPVTLMQQRLLFLEEMEPQQRVVHQLGTAFRLRGELDQSALRASVEAIVRRHGALRTVFEWLDGVPWQVVRDDVPELRLLDWSERPADEREAELLPFLRRCARETFDLTRETPFAPTLLRLDPQDHVLLFRTHNAVFDGWSFDLFRRELASLYAEKTGGPAAALPELPVSYTDFAAWHREWMDSPEIARQAAFWRERLAGRPQPLELPTDRPRGADESYEAATISLRLSRQEVDRLSALARQHGATLFMLLLAAFDALLYRYTGQRDILVGTPVQARTQPEVEHLIGLFVNAVVLRSHFDPAEAFTDHLQRVRATTLDAFSHQEMPFELLGRQAPVLRAFFSLQDARERASRLGDVALEQIPGISPGGATDVTLWLMEQRDGLFAALNYRTDLFERATMASFLGHYRSLLEALLRDPSQPLGRVPLRGEGAGSALSTPAAQSVAPLAHERLARRAGANGSAIAVEGPEASLSHAELEARASELALRLRSRGLDRGAAVGLCLPRSVDAIVALLGIWKAGLACAPVDVEDPKEIWQGMLAAAGAEVVVGDSVIEAELPPGIQLVRVAADREASVGSGELPKIAPDDLALIFPVLDAEGRCEGVELTHAALTVVQEAAEHVLGVTPRDIVLGLSPLSQECGVSELLAALGTGARLVLADDGLDGDAAGLAHALGRARATLLIAPAAVWHTLVEGGWQGDGAVTGVCAGELPSADLAGTLIPRLARLWSAWGEAELGFWAACRSITDASRASWLGAPLPGTQLLVLDGSGELAPQGLPGELCSAGIGLARVERGAGEAGGGTAPTALERSVFRSGARARLRSDGVMELLARHPTRGCVGGRRMEPALVERLLKQHPSVAEASVALDGPAPASRLVAYVVGRGEQPAVAELRRHVRGRVPPAFVPAAFVIVPDLPKTPEGEMDRAALPELATARAAALRPRLEPRSEIERALAEIWQDLLGVQVGLADNFFDLGGHSLLAAIAVHRMQQRTGRRVGLRQLMLQTLEQMAASLEGASVTAEASPADGSPRP